jgi:hypothetical protein
MYNEKGELINWEEHNSDQGGEEVRLAKKKEESIDKLRRDALMKVMKDKSLSKKEKARRMEEIRKKYELVAEEFDAMQASTDAFTAETEDLSPCNYNLRESSFRDSNLAMSCITTCASIGEEEDDDEDKSDFSSFLDAERDAEIQSVIKDKSLTKGERTTKIEKVKKKYAALTEGQGQPVVETKGSERRTMTTNKKIGTKIEMRKQLDSLGQIRPKKSLSTIKSPTSITSVINCRDEEVRQYHWVEVR